MRLFACTCGSDRFARNQLVHRMHVFDSVAVLVLKRIRLLKLDRPVRIHSRQLALAEQAYELVSQVGRRRQPVSEDGQDVQAPRRGLMLHMQEELLAPLARQKMKHAVSDDDVIGVRKIESEHVFADDDHVQRERLRTLSHSRARRAAGVNARDPHSCASQRNRISPHAATQVEDRRAPRDAVQEPRDLSTR